MLSLVDIFNVIKFPHVIENPSFLMATKYSTIWIYPGFLKHPLNVEQLGGFQFLPVVLLLSITFFVDLLAYHLLLIINYLMRVSKEG